MCCQCTHTGVNPCLQGMWDMKFSSNQRILPAAQQGFEDIHAAVSVQELQMSGRPVWIVSIQAAAHTVIPTFLQEAARSTAQHVFVRLGPSRKHQTWCECATVDQTDALVRTGCCSSSSPPQALCPSAREPGLCPKSTLLL